MNTLKSIAAGAFSLLALTQAQAQIPGANLPPRTDDHFQRRLVVSRIDLTEKVNQPLVSNTDPSFYSGGKYGEDQGLVAALIHGLQSGKYLAYNPDNLKESMTYEDVQALSKRCNVVDDELIDVDDWETEENEYLPDDEIEPSDEVMESGAGYSSGGFMPGGANGTATESEGVVLAPLETSIEFIENRIFDKNRSAEIHDIQYIRLVWVDPGETLPDKNFVCFKYSDLLETLEDTKWANRHNDAEDRNLREVFEERIFNSFVTNVSGNGVRTLPESAFRSQQMLQFEHELWSH